MSRWARFGLRQKLLKIFKIGRCPLRYFIQFAQQVDCGVELHPEFAIAQLNSRRKRRGCLSRAGHAYGEAYFRCLAVGADFGKGLTEAPSASHLPPVVGFVAQTLEFIDKPEAVNDKGSAELKAPKAVDQVDRLAALQLKDLFDCLAAKHGWFDGAQAVEDLRNPSQPVGLGRHRPIVQWQETLRRGSGSLIKVMLQV